MMTYSHVFCRLCLLSPKRGVHDVRSVYCRPNVCDDGPAFLKLGTRAPRSASAEGSSHNYTSPPPPARTIFESRCDYSEIFIGKYCIAKKLDHLACNAIQG